MNKLTDKIHFPGSSEIKETEMGNAADRELVEFLSEIDSETIQTLVSMLDTFWQNNVDSIKTDILSKGGIPESGTTERSELALKLVNILRYFGSDSIAYSWRKVVAMEPGVHYTEILRDVFNNLNKQLKKHEEIPRVASVSEYEQRICETMLKIQFEGKSEKEIAQMLEDAGLDQDAIKQTAKELAKFGVAGTGLLVLVKLLGKRIVTELIKKLIIMVVAKKLGQDAAEKLAGRILAKVAQKTVAKIISGIGWALFVWDAIDLAGPATRITIPVVSLIASVRTAKELETELRTINWD